MTIEPTHGSPSEAQSRTVILVRRVILAGWICVLLSASFLYLSHLAGSDGNFLWAILLMAARMCGISSFAIGVVAIYNRRWTTGVLMLLSSVFLPAIAFLVHGTI